MRNQVLAQTVLTPAVTAGILLFDVLSTPRKERKRLRNKQHQDYDQADWWKHQEDQE